MKTLVRAAFAAFALVACAAPSTDEASESALVASGPRFSLEEPTQDPKLEALRLELRTSEMGYDWVANQSATFAVRVEPWNPSANVGDVVRKAFAFRQHLGAANGPLLRNLIEVPRSGDGLAAALDAIGRSVDGPSVKTQDEREVLASRLRDAAAGDGVVVFRATLEEPDMYWEGVMAIANPAAGEILFTTGGYGT